MLSGCEQRFAVFRRSPWRSLATIVILSTNTRSKLGPKPLKIGPTLARSLPIPIAIHTCTAFESTISVNTRTNSRFGTPATSEDELSSIANATYPRNMRVIAAKNAVCPSRLAVAVAVLVAVLAAVLVAVLVASGGAGALGSV